MIAICGAQPGNWAIGSDRTAAARTADEDREDPGEDRPVDEIAEIDIIRLVQGSGLTGIPGRTRGPPSTITLSPALESAGHEPAVANGAVGLDDAKLGYALGADHQHGRPAALIAVDRALGDQDAARSGPLAKSGRERTCRAAGCAAGWGRPREWPANRSRGRPSRRQSSRSGQRIRRSAFELQPDRGLVAGHLAGKRLLAQAKQIGTRLLDVDEDRVEPLDGGQRFPARPGPAPRWYKASGRSAPRWARTVVRPRSISAERSAAPCASTSARASPAADKALSYSWRETKLRLTSSA